MVSSHTQTCFESKIAKELRDFKIQTDQGTRECFIIMLHWLMQLVRSLPFDRKLPSSIPGFAEV